ncbi:MAG TPA: nucleotidyltransferase family protein [Mycobacteriales bacterium]|nr:nucleotidyltransferase family protein [Mycobacteriales bacterium]
MSHPDAVPIAADRLRASVVARNIRLDNLAVRVSQSLTAEGVRHVLIKGPTTATWLYEPARPYRDVDMLIAWSDARAAVRRLRRLGLRTADGWYEGAAHSRVLLTPEGWEVDLHRALPGTAPGDTGRGELTWRVLADHIVPFALNGHIVSALDLPARCVVLALHALAAPVGAQERQDLVRALAKAGPATWREAEQIAEELGLRAELLAAVARERGEPGPRLPAAAYLRRRARPAGTLRRLLDADRGQLPKLIFRRLLPSPGYMRYAFGPPVGRGWLMRAHLRRWRRLARQLPEELRQARGVAGSPGTDDTRRVS